MIKEFSRGSAFAALMLLTPAVYAQVTTLPAVNPGRPTVTDVALLTVPGYLEMESGLNYVRGKTGSDDQSSQAILLKLTDRPGRTQLRRLRMGMSCSEPGARRCAALATR